MTHRFSRHRLSCFLAWLLCSALYFWTAESISEKSKEETDPWHHYAHLVDGYLAGHTHLSRAPAPELLALADPYDPKTNADFRAWDASLYQGKFYLYFGPTPALLTMLPWKLLTGHMLPQWAAAAWLSIAGFGVLTLLLAGIRRQWFPATTPAQLGFTVLLAGHICWLPVILRRPAFWELPIITAVALFWSALYCLWRFRPDRPSALWALAGGTALALMPGARPTYAVAVIFLIAFWAWPLLRDRLDVSRCRVLAALLAPPAAAAVSLVAYNVLRFGRPLEFGQSYQLWGADYRGIDLFSAGNFLPNVWFYLCALPDLSPYFPFLRTVNQGVLSAGYLGTEELPGLLFTLPALLLGTVALGTLALRPAGTGSRVVLAATCGGGITGITLFFFGGACSRYIVELLGGWTLLTGLGALALFATPSTQRGAGLLRCVTTLAAIWSVAAVWLCSFEFRRFARVTQPATYFTLAETLNLPSFWWAERIGHKFGPLAFDLIVPDEFAPGDTVVISTGRSEMFNQLVVERPAPQRVRLRITLNDLTIVTTPVIQHSGQRIGVELHTPWLYPPLDHPYWRTISDLDRRQRLQTTTVLATDAVSVIHENTTWFFDAIRFSPFVLTQPRPAPGKPWIDRIRVLDPKNSIAGDAQGRAAPAQTRSNTIIH
jgi:hypothetical protein